MEYFCDKFNYPHYEIETEIEYDSDLETEFNSDLDSDSDINDLEESDSDINENTDIEDEHMGQNGNNCEYKKSMNISYI